jgi:hypothetical protein
VDNVLQTDEGKARGLWREFIVGTKFNIDKIVLVYFDPRYTPSLPQSSKFGHSLGLEFVMSADLFLRLGQFRNTSLPFLASERGRGYSAGFGWVGPRLSIDYGLTRALEPRATTYHSFGVAAYF